MTDITKLLDEHPLPWNPFTTYGVRDATGRLVSSQSISSYDADLMLALANALHAERQKNTAPPSPSSTSTGVDPVAVGASLNDSGDVDALRYRVGEIEKRLDAIANAARGSDE